MSSELTQDELEVVNSLRTGGASARSEFFNQCGVELKRIAQFRIHPRLRRRLDDSDILQELYIRYEREIEDYLERPRIPPTVWLRTMLRQTLWRFHRDNVDAQCRDLRREIDNGEMLPVFIDDLAESISSLGSNLNKIEMRERIRTIVNEMPRMEREILTLVHFEERTVREASMELGIKLEAAKKRYRRALNRLRDLHQPVLQAYMD